MSEQANPRCAKALFVIAGLMTATLLGLLTFAGRSQNGNSFVATFHGYAASGEELWAVESDIDDVPTFIEDQVVFSIRGDGGAVTVGGDLVPYDGPQRIGPQTRIGDITYDSRGWPGEVVALDAEGQELWRIDGARFVDAGKDIAILIFETSKGPVASRNGVAMHHVVAAQSGEILSEYDGPRNRRPVAGDGVAAYTSAGMLTIVSPTAIRSFPVENITPTARVVLVKDGIVVTDQPAAGGRLIRGLDQASGTELWSRPVSSFGSYSIAGTFVAYTDDGRIDLDIQTGNMSAPWRDVVRDGVVEASVAEVIEMTPGGAVRHLRHGPGTIAVDAASGEVLWSDPDRYPVAASEQVAVFRTSDTYVIVGAETGETIASVERSKGSTIAVDDDSVLVVSDGKVSVVDRDGAVRHIGNLRKAARARAASDQHALVVIKPGANRKREAVVFDTKSGEVIVRQRVAAFSQVRLEADRVLFHHSADSDTVIDLSSSEVSRIDSDLFTVVQPTTRELAVVFDAGRQRLMWEQPLDGSSTVGTIGDVVVVIRTGSKRNGVIRYPGSGR